MSKTTEYSAGQVICFFREREGLTQEELADIIHVTKGKLAHWEDDVTIPRPTMVSRLQGALRISEADMPLLLTIFVTIPAQLFAIWHNSQNYLSVNSNKKARNLTISGTFWSC